VRPTLKTTLSLLMASFALSGTVAISPAYAAPLVEVHAVGLVKPPPPGGRRPVVTSDTGWAPAWTNLEAGGGACGGIVTGNPKDQDLGTREKRVITYRNGDVATVFRGSVTLMVGMSWDGWLPDPHYDPPVPMPVSGAVTQVDYASGGVYLDRQAPGIVLAHTYAGNGPETAAFVKAGLVSFYALHTGSLTEYARPNAAIANLSRPKSTTLTNVCDLVGQSDWRDHEVLVYGSEGIGGPITH